MSADNLPTPVPDDLAEIVDESTQIDTSELTPEDLELAESLVETQLAQAQQELVAGWQHLDLDRCQDALRRLHGWRICLNHIQQATSEGLTFHIDSLVLADCYQALFDEPEVETIVYLTGVQMAPHSVTLNRVISIAHDEQSSSKAAGNPEASFETLRELDQSGHRLLAHCHNHPESDGEQLAPSDEDHEYQQQLEDGEYGALGMIMAQDGHVRLFTNDLEFEVVVHGSNVRQVGEHRLFLEEAARDASGRIEKA